MAETCAVLGQPPEVVRRMTLQECRDIIDTYRRLHAAERS